MEKQYKRVSEDLLDYMKDMYGVINTDTIPAKIVMEEFDCNGFINNAGEEVDPRTTVRFPKGVVILTNKNGSKISIGKKGETTTNKKYPFDVIINGKDGHNYENPTKKLTISYLDIKKTTYADYETNSEYCNSIITLDTFSKLYNTALNIPKENAVFITDIKNVHNLINSSVKESFRSVLGLEFIFANDGEIFTIMGSQLAQNLNGVNYFILRIEDVSKLRANKDDVVSALSTAKFIMVVDKSGIQFNTNGLLLVNENFSIKTGKDPIIIPRNSLILMESLEQMKKINTDIANGSEGFLFLINTNDPSYNKFKSSLLNATACGDDTTNIPVLENIVSYICQFGRMFYNFLTGEKSKGINDTNYSVDNLEKYKVLSEIYNNDFNKISEKFKKEYQDIKTDEELFNFTNKYCGKYGLKCEAIYEKTESKKRNVKGDLFKLLKEMEKANQDFETNEINFPQSKEQIAQQNLDPSLLKNPENNDVLKTADVVNKTKDTKETEKMNSQEKTKRNKEETGDRIIGYKVISRSNYSTEILFTRDDSGKTVNSNKTVEAIKKDADNYMNEEVTKRMGSFMAETANTIMEGNKKANDSSGSEEGDKIQGAYYYRSLKEGKEKAIELCKCVQKEMQRMSGNLEGYKFLEDNIYEQFNKEVNDYTNPEQFSIKDSSPNDSTAKELTEKAEQTTNPKESISLYNIKSNLFKILTEADDKKQYYEFLGSVSIKNNADYNLISSYGRGDNTKVADCFIGTSKLKSAEASLANWSSVIDRYANELASLGSWLDQTYIKTGTSLTTRATDTAKTISKAGKTVAGLGDKISGKSK